ncbi:reversion-inducing cysteine-rich protein with Kazal motifs-like isoform X2 [Tachypleus tridentatus]|uniref:reversion-inducing cysteine-rich protein with Kazal motifs-like isoform X2 n=1 Tax=Tachypleus tridentatus TaxID=6853 RepID=UPI003FD1740E
MGGMVAVIGVIVLAALGSRVSALAPTCCDQVTGSCRRSCEEMSLVDISTDEERRQDYLTNLNRLCSKLLVGFWKCMNETLEEVDRGADWAGRPCCNVPQTASCRLACLKAQSRPEVSGTCRHSDEISFYFCVERQEVGESCCQQSKRSECRKACWEVFRSVMTPSKTIREAVFNQCAQHSPEVLRCLRNYTHTTPADNPTRNLHCCEQSSNRQCREICRDVLHTQTTDQEIIDSLIQGGCGPPLPHDELWQCFLANADSSNPVPGTSTGVETTGLDSAKLQCCYRAVTLTCQRLCLKTFSNEWTTTWNEFHKVCQYKPAEADMLHCLADEEPCELGCEGLNYCSNFNYRPTQLFRSCEVRADSAAGSDVELWREGVIRLPLLDVPVLDITTCYPETWKAIACVLQIKPCHQRSHTNMICKSDCIDILSKCVDYSRLPSDQTPTTLCEVLSPPGEDPPCISLKPYLEESIHVREAAEVTYPCTARTCNGTDVCIVNRECSYDRPCFPHKCLPGCKLGEMSHLVVPKGSYVRIPQVSHEYRCKKEQQICQCSANGKLEKCINLPCVDQKSCWLKGDKIPHNFQFYIDCNKCICLSGEIVCSQRSCHPNTELKQSTYMYTGLPCNCPDHYVPVCGINGKTYPSACLAMCAGLREKQFDFGACSSVDPCKPNPCRHHQKCFPKQRVCLSYRHHRCKQYDCVSTRSGCSHLHVAPVCDTENTEHGNLCWLLKQKKTLAYHGKCLDRCSRWGTVCGHNGQTYPSECAALADRSTVDYTGPCVAVGIFKRNEPTKGFGCRGIRCPTLPSPHCSNVIPPGACCPVCGAVVAFLFSRRQADIIVRVVQDVKPVVVQTIAEKLRYYVKVAECDVFSYLSLESEVIVTVTPITATPTFLQVETCVNEAEKIKTLVEMTSPAILTDLSLSLFLAASLEGPLPGSVSACSPAVSFLYAPGLTLVILVFCLILHR